MQGNRPFKNCTPTTSKPQPTFHLLTIIFTVNRCLDQTSTRGSTSLMNTSGSGTNRTTKNAWHKKPKSWLLSRPSKNLSTGCTWTCKTSTQLWICRKEQSNRVAMTSTRRWRLFLRTKETSLKVSTTCNRLASTPSKTCRHTSVLSSFTANSLLSPPIWYNLARTSCPPEILSCPIDTLTAETTPRRVQPETQYSTLLKAIETLTQTFLMALPAHTKLSLKRSEVASGLTTKWTLSLPLLP